jgi:predicted tellurium resistance membrane protein TerC
LETFVDLAADPSAWAALATLIAMEVVLGVDNLIFVSILTNNVAESRRALVRRIGLSVALIFRLALLATVASIVKFIEPIVTILGHAFSWRDIILLAGGLFLVWKATREIHHNVDPREDDGNGATSRPVIGTASAISQIILLDLVFSIDSIVTAVGMTDHIPIMAIAVVIAVCLMMVAVGPLSRFIGRNPTIVMLALSFLLMIGMTLIADGFGVHVPKGYIYAAMIFSAVVETLNMAARSRRSRPKKP